MKKFLLLCSFILVSSFAYSQCNTTNATSCVCLDTSQSDCDLLPDIKVGEPPLLVSGSNGIIEYSQTGNGAEDGHLRLSVSTPNIGVGPLTVRTTTTYVCGTDTFIGTPPAICPDGITYPKQLVVQRVLHKTGNTMSYYDRAAGTMTYHPSHGHMHVDDWGIYTLRIQDTLDPNPLNWPIVGTGAKLAFCLMDYGDCSFYEGHCTDDINDDTLLNGDFPNWGLGGGQYNCSPVEQGISSGYTDIYYQYLDGMYITIPPGTCNGNYWIVVQIDPYDYFLESNENNNVRAVPITLTLQESGTASVTATGSLNICPGSSTTLLANPATSYLWSNGATTQSISVTYAGTYTVDVTNSCGTHTSQPVTITSVNAATPVAVDDTVCINTSATLNAAGTATGIMNWYDAATGGNLLYTGNAFTTPVLSAATTYHVDQTDVVPGDTAHSLPFDNTIGTGANHTNDTRYLVFTTHTSLILESVKVYAQGAGSRVIELRDENDAVLQSVNVTLPNGESRATLNFTVNPGVNYHLGVGSTPNLYRNDGGVSFPYSIPGYLDITNSSAGQAFYYFFYDWKIRGLDVTCTSPRIPVTAFVESCTGISESEFSSMLSIYPNPVNDILQIEFPGIKNKNVTIEMEDYSGKTVYKESSESFTGDFTKKIDVSSFAKGIYFITFTDGINTVHRKVTVGR